jgi:hypothetical protein
LDYKLLPSYMLPAGISILNPIELLVDRSGLEELVRDNIRIHQAGSMAAAHSPESRLNATLLIQQLEEFAAWVAAQPDGPVSMLMYPDPGQDAPQDFGTKHVS